MGQKRKKRKKQKNVKLTRITWQINADEWLPFKRQEVNDMKKKLNKEMLISVFITFVFLLLFFIAKPLVALIMFMFFVIIGFIVKKRVIKPFHETTNKQIEVTNVFEILFTQTKVSFLNFSFSMSECFIQTTLKRSSKYNVDCLYFETVDEYIEQSIDGIGGGTSEVKRKFYVPIPKVKTEEEIKQVLDLYRKNENFVDFKG